MFKLQGEPVRDMWEALESKINHLRTTAAQTVADKLPVDVPMPFRSGGQPPDHQTEKRKPAKR